MTGTAVVIWNPPGVLPLVHAQRERSRDVWTEFYLSRAMSGWLLLDALHPAPPGMTGRFATFSTFSVNP